MQKISPCGVARVALPLLCSLACCVVAADEKQPQPSAEGIRFFEANIRPVLVESCYRCHSADGQGIRGGLSVDSRDGLLAGGESGPAIVPGHPEDSVLWEAINHQGLQMPPRQKLPAETIEHFRTWILMGAPDPRVSTVAVVKSRVTADDIEAGRQFWSFRPPVMPEIPDRDASEWGSSAIDRLIAQMWVTHELQPAADADPLTVLRRLHFDLTGLPPSPDDMVRFSEAWAKNVDQAVAQEADQLLASPRFGERWGRHWLDVARYAESAGKEVDMTFPNAWRYRDYVIDSFNNDKPYDEFVREQVAGDLLPAKDDAEWVEHLIATGFLALGPKALIEQNPRQFQADLIDEQIDTTTRVVLGVSVACARCHDHKFDPIPQADYYALAGIFQSTETFYGGARSQRNRQPSHLIILPLDDPNPSDRPLTRQELADLKQQRDQAERDAMEARRAARQPAASSSEKNEPRRAMASQFLLDQQVAQLTNRINGVDENGQPLTFCMGVQAAERPRKASVLVRGEIDQPAQEVDRGFVQVLCRSNLTVPADSTGRLEMAEWMTSRDQPLTGRVMANRVWQHLLGAAIVRETENFGMSGPAPTHPELLDYLAIRFMDSGWSVKKLIREIATSRVYRLSSAYQAERFEKDPDNLYLSRANVRRLDAEALRDAMLASSGQLDLKRPRGSAIASMGSTLLGPNGPAFPLPAMATQNGDGRRPSVLGNLIAGGRPGMRPSSANPLDPMVGYRSVYLPVARNALPRALEVFDFAEPSMVIGQRESSNTPAQGLYLLNNPFVVAQSDALAQRVAREASSPVSRVERAFQLVYGRGPTAEERASSMAFFRSVESPSVTPASRGRLRDDQKRLAFSEFCQALFASAEFRYLN